MKQGHRPAQTASVFQRAVEYMINDAAGTHFLLLESVDGADLSSLVKQDGPLPARLAGAEV